MLSAPVWCRNFWAHPHDVGINERCGLSLPYYLRVKKLGVSVHLHDIGINHIMIWGSWSQFTYVYNVGFNVVYRWRGRLNGLRLPPRCLESKNNALYIGEKTRTSIKDTFCELKWSDRATHTAVSWGKNQPPGITCDRKQRGWGAESSTCSDSLVSLVRPCGKRSTGPLQTQ